jgi:hypothetical protein
LPARVRKVLQFEDPMKMDSRIEIQTVRAKISLKILASLAFKIFAVP